MKGMHLYRCQQRGIVMPLTAIAMLSLIAITGLALDMGHLFVNHTRLQNAVDAAALSAAKTINDAGNDPAAIAAATAAANKAFDDTKTATGNAELAGLTVTMQYSATVNPFAAGSAPPKFARASVAGFSRPSALIGVLGFPTITTGASAVAGPSATLDTVCDIIPIAACSGGAAPNFGYVNDKTYVLSDCFDNGFGCVGPGNFRNIRLGCTGAACVRDGMSGKTQSCATKSNSVTTEPGVAAGPNGEGLNQRFACPTGGGIKTCGGFAGDTAPDKVSNAGGAGYPDTYTEYKNAYASGTFDHPTGLENRRMIRVPMINCTGTGGGTSSVTVVGFGCFFLTEPVQNGKYDCGTGLAKKDQPNSPICASFKSGAATAGCPGVGIPGTGTGPGPYTIVLYNDTPGAIDS